MRRVAAALVLACLVASVWLGRSSPVARTPEPPVAAAAPPLPPSSPVVRAPAPPATRRAARLLRSATPALVSGCVVHENGDPAADADVHVEADTEIALDDDGCFRVEVAPGDYALWASLDHVGGVAFAASALEARAEPDACGDAAAHAARRPRHAPMGTLTVDDAPRDADETFTDDDGHVWPALEASDWTPLTLAPGEEADGVELVLRKGRAVAGRVNRDARICVAPASFPAAETCQQTDEGSFTLGPLPGGPLRLIARDVDADDVLLAAELPEARGGLRLQLPPGATDGADAGGADGDGADVAVDDSLADVPLRPLEVRVADEHGAPVEAGVTIRAAGYLDSFYTDGSSTVDVPRDHGCVSVCASADDRLEDCAAIRGEARIELVLREPTSVHGFVRLPGGAPAAGARVRCGGAGHRRVAETDARGQFSLSCARTTSTLELLHDGDAVAVPIALDGADEYVEIRL